MKSNKRERESHLITEEIRSGETKTDSQPLREREKDTETLT